MHVLHFYKSYYPESLGGVEQVIRQICRGTAPLGVDSAVCALASQPSREPVQVDNHLVYQAKRDFHIASTGFSLSAFKVFAEQAQKADLIHYHYPWPFMDLVHFVTRIKKPTVVTYHLDIFKQKNLLHIYKPLQEKFLNAVDALIATSPHYLASSPVLQKYKDKTHVIPICVDRHSYPAVSAACLAKWRARFPERFFLFVGVLRYYKGLHDLLEAAHGTDFSIVIVGQGPVEYALKLQAQRMGLTHVHFVGPLDDEDKTALFQLCYGFVFPSCARSEAFGIALLEAAMHGKPMICCNIQTGTTYINVHGETGLVVPPAHPQGLREAMANLWNNPEGAAHMGRAALARYDAFFTFEQMAQSHVALYHNLLSAA